MDIEIKKAFRRYESSKIDTGVGITEQSHKKECDMNHILKDYKRTGFIRHAKENQGRYDDISVQDFQDAMFKVAEATNMFNDLPANLRKDFNNNPAEFLGFVQNPANQEKLQSMGIIRGNDGIDMNGMPTTAPLYKDPYAKPVPVQTESVTSTAAPTAPAVNTTPESA